MDKEIIPVLTDGEHYCIKISAEITGEDRWSIGKWYARGQCFYVAEPYKENQIELHQVDAVNVEPVILQVPEGYEVGDVKFYNKP